MSNQLVALTFFLSGSVVGQYSLVGNGPNGTIADGFVVCDAWDDAFQVGERMPCLMWREMGGGGISMRLLSLLLCFPLARVPPTPFHGHPFSYFLAQ